MDEISNRMEYTTVIVVVQIVVVSKSIEWVLEKEVHHHHIAAVAFALVDVE